MNQPDIIDLVALERNRHRAIRLNKDGADFLSRFTVEDMALRLSAITRDFEKIMVLNSATDELPDALRSRFPKAELKVKRTDAFREKWGGDPLLNDETVALEPGAHDLIVSPLSLQFTNDLPGALIQIRRALKPDGLFMGAIVGGSTLNELRQTFLEAEAELSGSAHARILPFVDVRDAGGLLQRAGFALPVSDTDKLTVRYDTMFSLMQDLRAMGAQNCLSTRTKRFSRREVLMKAAALYQEKFSDTDGRIRATFEIVSLSGWAPHESQQKPLKPGSAKMRLEDGLIATRSNQE